MEQAAVSWFCFWIPFLIKWQNAALQQVYLFVLDNSNFRFDHFWWCLAISGRFICCPLHNVHLLTCCIDINLKKKSNCCYFAHYCHITWILVSAFQHKCHHKGTLDQTSQIVFCSASSLLPSCNLQHQWMQTRFTTINWIQCLFSCSMWHQNVNWFCLLSYTQTKKKKKCSQKQDCNIVYCHEGHEGYREKIKIIFFF